MLGWVVLRDECRTDRLCDRGEALPAGVKVKPVRLGRVSVERAFAFLSALLIVACCLATLSIEIYTCLEFTLRHRPPSGSSIYWSLTTTRPIPNQVFLVFFFLQHVAAANLMDFPVCARVLNIPTTSHLQ